MENLKVGARGDVVAEIQAILGLKPDGIFGKLTDQYVRNFQQQNSLTVDGIVGVATLAAMRDKKTVSHIATTLTATGQFQLSERSISRLIGVHPDLIKVVRRAIEISSLDFMVIEGVRTMTQQIIYLKTGKSKTLKGRHIPDNNACKLSCAVDLGVMIAGILVWDKQSYITLSKIVKQAAKEVGVPIEWGGDWKSLWDGPHFQLPWSVYK